MNCKTKALVVGIGWGVGMLLALAALLAILTGLFMIGDAIGINFAAIISVTGFGIAFLMIARLGYNNYLKGCKDENII